MNENRNRTGAIVAVALLTMVLLCVMATPAAAVYTETTHASYNTKVHTADGKWHYALVYYIPHDTLGGDFKNKRDRYYPYIGGANRYLLEWFVPQHSNPQEWDFYSRTQVNANWDKATLMIPKRYVWVTATTGDWKKVYIKYYRR